MDEMRRPLFVIALVLLVCVVGVEIGSSLFIAPAVTTGAGLEAALDAAHIDEDDRPSQEEREALAETDDPPGLAIPMLALIDGLLLLSMLGLGAALVIPHRIQGRIVAPVNLVVSFLLILAAIILVIVMLVLLFLMIGLFLAAPFGTITYLIRWGFFPRGEAQVTLALLWALKLGFAGFVVAASPRLLRQKGFVALVATSFLLQLLVGFLHGLAPRPLVSIIAWVARPNGVSALTSTPHCARRCDDPPARCGASRPDCSTAAHGGEPSTAYAHSSFHACG